MKIKEIVRRDVPFITSDMTYVQSAKLLKKNKLTGAPVVDSAGLLVGLVSEKDLLSVLYPFYSSYYENPEKYADLEKRESKILEIKDLPITKFMNKKVISFELETPIMQAGGKMLAKGLHIAPVIDPKGKIIGIIRRTDIYHKMFDEYLSHSKKIAKKK